MANNVLDALISREDFEALSANEDAAVQQTIGIRDLEERAFFYLALRKPDFQRESSEWDANRVARLIRTFIEGDLIPSVILWKHREHLFVIDGSHRLSALIAWVQDDFGDGERPQRFFGHSIPAEQLAHAERTRKLITKEIGSYADHVAAASNPDAYGPDGHSAAARSTCSSFAAIRPKPSSHSLGLTNRRQTSLPRSLNSSGVAVSPM